MLLHFRENVYLKAGFEKDIDMAKKMSLILKPNVREKTIMKKRRRRKNLKV
jgi:hypothetical protein